MSKYSTRQRTRLMTFLSTNADTALSAKQIALALEPENISLSSVYRYLSDLEKEGRIRKLTRPGQREVFYQYTAHENCKDVLHFSCTLCGRTTHLDKVLADILMSHSMDSFGFEVDMTKTVIYGVCKSCRK
ncbi:MAG: transcriptional repressor [Eubacteriaceae bacterium]|nr:transcriptional repressor [Eubacteriaceae bacterium]